MNSAITLEEERGRKNYLMQELATTIQTQPSAVREGQLATTIKTQAPPATVFLNQIAFGMKMTQALYVAAKLGIADLLVSGPRPVQELSEATETSERALYRVLRSLAAVDIFRETESKVFELTTYAEALRSDAPNSFRNAAIFMGEEMVWNTMGQMLYSVKTGKSACKRVLGSDAFEYLAANPDQFEIFNRAMTDLTVSAAPAIVDAYDFSDFKKIVDIAGGHGYLLSQILKANSGLRGVLFDMPEVIDGAGVILEREGVADRVAKITGNFFESVPAGADVYVLKHIIHDWDDESSLKILRNVRSAMSSEAKLLVMEMVVPEGNEPHPSKILDLSMLVLPGGVERTEAEYHVLFNEAGLRLRRVVPTQTPLSILEVVKD
jgi:hypothetical protein